MVSDYDALLAAVLADPDADLPRLVLADWLEETGHPANCARAEYIRFAIEHCQSVITKDIDIKGKQLKKMFADEWDVFKNKSRRARREVEGHRYRGFVGVVNCADHRLGTICRLAEGRLPVTNIGVNPCWTPRVSTRGWALPKTLTGFSLIGPNSLPDWFEPAVAGSRAKLKRLELFGCGLTAGSVVQFARHILSCPALRTLVELDLRHNPLTDHAAHALAAADMPPTLRSLNVEDTRITNAGREVLFRRFGFEQLRPL